MLVYRAVKSPPPDRWERAKTLSTIFAAVVVPIVILVVGNIFSSALKQRETEGKFVELAVAILREPPGKPSENLRDWATQVITRYSGVPLSSEARRDLIEIVPLPRLTQAYQPFTPGRVITFGDEFSLLTRTGQKYMETPTRNGKIDCAANPLWVQALSAQYGFVFAECNPEGAGNVKAYMRAAEGAKVEDIARQIEAQLARKGSDGGIKRDDLVTVLAGVNDLLALYAQYPSKSEAEITEELKERGLRLAIQVNRVASEGARVIVSTIPDLGLSPFAIAEARRAKDKDRQALLSRLSAAFNSRLRVNVLNDGRLIGLVFADELVQSMVRAPDAFGLENATEVVCSAPLPNCVLKDSALGSRRLWADHTRLSYEGQLRLGTLALARATGNPF